MKNDMIFSDNSLELSKMLHEIKNPLTLISSSLQLIECDHPEVTDFHFWTQTRKDLRALCCLLNDLSAFHKGNIVNRKKINLFDFTEDLLESLESFLSERETPLILESAVSDLDFYGDPLTLRQALINLLKNASESSQKGVPIRLKITTGPNLLFMTVIDRGCGITQKNRKHLYEPFRTTKTYGTGMGLAVAKKIIDSHHGTLSVFSTPGAGTAFLLKLPLH